MADRSDGLLHRRDFLKLTGMGTTSALFGPSLVGLAKRVSARQAPSLASPGPADWARSSDFAADPPFSFVYGGEPSSTLLARWPSTVRAVTTAAGRTEDQVTWADPVTGLVVEATVVRYPAFGAREWTVWFANAGRRVSRRLSSVLGADTVLGSVPAAQYLLHHFNGSAQAASDYAPIETRLRPGVRKLLFPFGGRPSNGTWPYFNVQWGERGAMVAVGWPGQWTVELVPNTAQGLILRAGMTSVDPVAHAYEEIAGAGLLDTTLEPGEQVRAPLIVVMDWAGPDWTVAQNSWRRWMWEFNLPRYAGQLPSPIATTSGAISLYPDQPAELDTIRDYVEQRTTPDRGGFYTHWWVDAGWYAIPLNSAMFTSDPWYYGVGNWYPDPVRFPQGLRPTFQEAAAHGMKSILWSEPERAMASTWIADNHPAWLLGPQGPVSQPREVTQGIDYLVNFGDSSVLQWMVEHFDGVITSQGARDMGINVFRQDFNMDPLDYWNAADTPGRSGMTQMKHVLGHLSFWDQLRDRHPAMWVDSCASGGRRNDLETMRRAVPLWRSDYQYDPTGTQCQTYGISLWLPYFGAALDPQSDTLVQYGPPSYGARSAFAPCLISDVDPDTASAADWQLLRTVNEEFTRVKDDLLYSDFYPLTGYSLALDVWMAFQYNRPEAGSGVIEAFRRPDAKALTQSFRLHGLVADRLYRLENLVSGTSEVRTGRSLMEGGLPITLASAPDAAIVSYALAPS